MLIIVWLIKAILFFLLFIVVVLIVMLCIPVKYSISGKKDNDSQLSMNISWAFNLIKVALCYKGGSKLKTDFILFGHSTPINGNSKKDEKTRNEKEKKHNKKKKKMHPRQLINKSMLDSVTVLLKDIMRWLKPKKFKLSGIFGFEDPYYTGILYCILDSFKGQLQNGDISVIAVFDREVFEANFEIEGKLTMSVLLLIFIKFILSKPMRKIILYQIRR